MGYLEFRRQQEEEHLSYLATKSMESKGRVSSLPEDSTRTDFERDCHRIIHSWPFRRLRNKAQVFYAPKNDHLCTRIEHALLVASISNTICRHLNLNTDLAEAIALAHDLGHPPFGHIGEDILKNLHRKNHLPIFRHEAHGLRIIDRFKRKGETLNLTYEVRDGVVCHCGEKFLRSIRPNRKKNITEVSSSAAKRQMPATLEGCVVRLADVISYVGRDFEDAKEVGIIDERKRPLPPVVKQVLGANNREIVHSIIRDVVQESQEMDKINLSDNTYNAVKALLDYDIRYIYENKTIMAQQNRIDQMLTDIFNLVVRQGVENRKQQTIVISIITVDEIRFIGFGRAITGLTMQRIKESLRLYSPAFKIINQGG